MIGGLATIAYQIYQEFKGEKEHKKYMNRLHDAIWNVTAMRLRTIWDDGTARCRESKRATNSIITTMR